MCVHEQTEVQGQWLWLHLHQIDETGRPCSQVTTDQRDIKHALSLERDAKDISNVFNIKHGSDLIMFSCVNYWIKEIRNFEVYKMRSMSCRSHIRASTNLWTSSDIDAITSTNMASILN